MPSSEELAVAEAVSDVLAQPAETPASPKVAMPL
jgi:hypothetical protein